MPPGQRLRRWGSMVADVLEFGNYSAPTAAPQGVASVMMVEAGAGVLLRWRPVHLRPMEPFRLLDHTADVGFEAFGGTLEETFANAGRALTNLFVDLESIQPREQVLIKASSKDLEALLVNFLSEVLFLTDAEGWLLREFDVQLAEGPLLQATAWGEKFDRSRHQAKTPVKAITYHQLALEQFPDGWRARIYVDI